MSARSLASAIVALALSVSTACVSMREGRELDADWIEPGVTTKADLVRRLGAPHSIDRRGGELRLQFRFAETNGTAFGVGTYGISVSIQTTQKGIDTLEVLLDEQGVVQSFRVSHGPRETPLWPSG